MTVAVEDSAETTRRLRDDYAIAVRDTQDMGYPGHVRVSLGEQGELERALRTLGRSMINWGRRQPREARSPRPPISLLSRFCSPVRRRVRASLPVCPEGPAPPTDLYCACGCCPRFGAISPRR